MPAEPSALQPLWSSSISFTAYFSTNALKTSAIVPELETSELNSDRLGGQWGDPCHVSKTDKTALFTPSQS